MTGRCASDRPPPTNTTTARIVVLLARVASMSGKPGFAARGTRRTLSAAIRRASVALPEPCARTATMRPWAVGSSGPPHAKPPAAATAVALMRCRGCLRRCAKRAAPAVAPSDRVAHEHHDAPDVGLVAGVDGALGAAPVECAQVRHPSRSMRSPDDGLPRRARGRAPRRSARRPRARRGRPTRNRPPARAPAGRTLRAGQPPGAAGARLRFGMKQMARCTAPGRSRPAHRRCVRCGSPSFPTPPAAPPGRSCFFRQRGTGARGPVRQAGPSKDPPLPVFAPAAAGFKLGILAGTPWPRRPVRIGHGSPRLPGLRLAGARRAVLDLRRRPAPDPRSPWGNPVQAMAASSGGEAFRPRLIRARRFPRRRRAQVTSINARPEGAQGLAVNQVTEAVAALDTSKNKSLNQYDSGVCRFRPARGRDPAEAPRRSGQRDAEADRRSRRDGRRAGRRRSRGVAGTAEQGAHDFQ